MFGKSKNVEISYSLGMYYVWIGVRMVGKASTVDEAVKIKKMAEEGIFG